MKVKALRDKDTKEFIHLMQMGEKVMVCTGATPNVQPMTATIELMKERRIDAEFYVRFIPKKRLSMRVIMILITSNSWNLT